MTIRIATALTLAAACAQAQSWQLAQPLLSPNARSGPSIAYDSARRCTIVFGGHDWTPNVFLQDHWEYDGQTWVQRTPAVTPPARHRGGMCYDESRGVTVLFGGTRYGTFQPSVYLNDTWEYDGTSWREVTPAGVSPARRAAELAYDPARQKVLLFGGYGDTAPYQKTDTWEFDGTSWTERTTQSRPPARFDYSLAFDRRRAVLVVHPGFIMGQMGPFETWEFDGNDWARCVYTTPGPMFQDKSMVYDERREVVMLVGSPYGSDAQTWEYDGTDWVQGATLPSNGLAGHGMTFDRARSAVVAFGGNETQGMFIVDTDKTWEFGQLAGATMFGAGCPAMANAPSLAPASTPPQPGTTFVAEVPGIGAGTLPLLAVGLGTADWNGAPLPMDLSVFGLPGCDLLVSVDLAVVLPVQGATAHWQLPVPAHPLLIGTTIYGQTMLLSGPAPIAVTNGLAVTVGL